MAPAFPQIYCEARTVTRQTLCDRASNIKPRSASDLFAANAMNFEATRFRAALLIRERESAASARIEAELARMRRK
jgi:hypothetical protein